MRWFLEELLLNTRDLTVAAVKFAAAIIPDALNVLSHVAAVAMFGASLLFILGAW
jgi:hypothetical protein